MKQSYKASIYNRFIPLKDGRRLAFNSNTCGLMIMGQESYERYQHIAQGDEELNLEEPYCKMLKEGGFLVPLELDEVKKLEAQHYQTRFTMQSLGFTIAPTLECNFACSYCYESPGADTQTPKRMGPEVQEALIQFISQKVAENGVVTITWYGGEPLLCLDIVKNITGQIRDVCQKKNARSHFGMVTNGYLLTPEVQQELADVGVSWFQITLDGPAEIHDQRRPLRGGGPTYQRIIDNLVQMNERLSASLRVNVDRRNRESMPHLLQEIVKHGLHQRANFFVNFSPVLATANACTDAVADNCYSIEEFSLIDINLFRELLLQGIQTAHFPRPAVANCGAISPHSFLITPDGAIHKCWNTISEPDKAVGHLLQYADEPQYEVNLIKWQSWRPFKGDCNSCLALPVCMGGCAYREIYEDQVMEPTQEPCHHWKYHLDEFLTTFYEAKMDSGLSKLIKVD